MNSNPSESFLADFSPKPYSLGELNSLLEEHLARKEQLFFSINQLVSKLYQTQQLLKHNREQEALLLVAELVDDGECITRQF
ncbi:hypothetical protein VB715_07050 [Crocosphaera sp. UHCC 0190]|uniref:hypothetical protein n=1 Tax=Crocosphaera sp. UHCC 0190 TaxID=3110246 RepID=UPI002B1FE9A5|nr:hypothetical protein [Crocosphaera sp. UHCC 0190]MEA5509517.1 hypothetical protein [Crocosphaera sp. UHCC 0190]